MRRARNSTRPRSWARQSSAKRISRPSSRSARMTERCDWGNVDAAMAAYHDLEWGVPLHDDRALFELLSLECAQAGLSWSTILRRRDGYRRAFENFDIERVAAFEDSD